MRSKTFPITVLCFLLTLSLALPVIAQQPFATLTSNEQVAQFLADATDNHEVTITVGDFRKVDLDGDGRAEMVATVDYSGRAFFNTLAVVWNDAQGPRVQTIAVWNVPSLDGVIQDLDGDGKQEIVAPELLTPYLGVRPHAVWTSVHALAGRDFADRSSRFRAFYKKSVLPALNEKLERFRAAGETHDAEVTEVALYKTLRTIGEEPQAGLSRALSWASDSDALTRVFAIAVLRDINEPSAAATLGKLTHDPDRDVANFAKSATAEGRVRHEQ